MQFEQFHFENPYWLWLLIAIPCIWLLYSFFHHSKFFKQNLENFIDKDLLPHLLKNNQGGNRSIYKKLVIWSLIWACFSIAMAGPRWDYTDIDTFTPDQSLVILLDLSKSMDATDENPSRLARAKQEIEDILTSNNNIKIGLVAFAADSHMISPITDDMETIRNLLPSLTTDIVYIQGSKLSPALDMAKKQLAFESGKNKSILLISDGGFEDGSAIGLASDIAKEGIVINTMGVGSKEGAPIPDGDGSFVKQNGKTLVSTLDSQRLKAVSDAGGGYYIKAEYLGNDTKKILSQIEAKAKAEEKTKHKTRQWEERFYLLLIPVMLLLLPWFRRGYSFGVVMFLVLLPAQNSHAISFEKLFKNDEQLAKQYLENSEYEKAEEKFSDAYRRGIAQYKAGKYEEAEKSFAESSREEVQLNAKYNLGNALAHQQKFEDAIDAYENVIEKQPDNENAKHNLEVVKKLLEQQQKQENKNQDSQEGDKSEDSKQAKQSKSEKASKNDKSEEQESKEQDLKQANKADEKESEQSKLEEKQNADEEKNMNEQDMAKPSEQQDENPNEKQNKNTQRVKTQTDIDADQWLNKITNEPKSFLKNQFYIESKRKGTKQESNPW
jgi:Ca-activated chloride channel family protein